MKQNGTFFLLIFLMLASCSDNYTVENKMYNCNIDGFKDHNYDLRVNMTAIEVLLTAENILKSSDGKGYSSFLVEMSQGAWDNPDIQQNTRVALSELIKAEDNYFCSLEDMGLDSAQFKDSKFHEIILDYNRLYPTQNGQSKVFTGKEYAEFYAAELTAKDLENEFYKYTVIYSFAYHFVNDSDQLSLRE